MDPDKTSVPAPLCLRCGRCCRYGRSLNATRDDLIRWIEEGRSDILRLFEAYCSDGRYVSCAGFSSHQALPEILWTDMINPETGDYYIDCPFLKPLAEQTWFCSIYDTRPAICIRFRPWEWGEKGVFFACPVVERIQDTFSPGHD